MQPSSSKSQQRLTSVALSKKLSWLLRHGAEREGLPIQSDGYIAVPVLLNHRQMSQQYNLQILQDIVSQDSKQRYSMRRNPTTGQFEIRANQGHSMDVVKSMECMTRIHEPSEVPLAVHGTYYRCWPKILAEGLKRMTRNHIHFAINDQGSAISGFRADCEILIFLNVRKAMTDGRIKLYRSLNGVILSPGIDGTITKEYFQKVLDRKSGEHLLPSP